MITSRVGSHRLRRGRPEPTRSAPSSQSGVSAAGECRVRQPPAALATRGGASDGRLVKLIDGVATIQQCRCWIVTRTVTWTVTWTACGPPISRQDCSRHTPQAALCHVERKSRRSRGRGRPGVPEAANGFTRAGTDPERCNPLGDQFHLRGSCKQMGCRETRFRSEVHLRSPAARTNSGVRASLFVNRIPSFGKTETLGSRSRLTAGG